MRTFCSNVVRTRIDGSSVVVVDTGTEVDVVSSKADAVACASNLKAVSSLPVTLTSPPDSPL